jgi:hypothetical protein
MSSMRAVISLSWSILCSRGLGDLDAISARIREHLDAGADHVARSELSVRAT